MSEPLYFPDRELLIKHINKLRKDHKITQQDLADECEIPQGTISKLIGNHEGIIRGLSYEEAQKIYNTLLNLISPFKDEPISNIATKSEGVETVELDDRVSDAAKKMVKWGYTQLIVKNENGKNEGVITDFMILNAMLYPKEKSKEWLTELGNMTIRNSGLLDRIPVFPETDTQAEVASSLVYHYAVLVDEGNGNFGIATRNDYMKLLK
jgi:predicted transcriptional regulator